MCASVGPLGCKAKDAVGTSGTALGSAWSPCQPGLGGLWCKKEPEHFVDLQPSCLISLGNISRLSCLCEERLYEPRLQVEERENAVLLGFTVKCK